MTMKQKLYVFDFDGTLTTRDTLLEFIRYAKGTPRFMLGFLLHAPLLVLMKLHLYPNYKAKERVFAHFFGGMTIADFDDACQHFAHDNRSRLLRPHGQAEMERALRDGAKVLIVSASIDNWVRPFFRPQTGSLPCIGDSRVEVIGTQIEVSRGIVTGRFVTPNCYGQEKVRRLEQALTAPRSHYEIIAFGDSRGDKELLAYADEAHFKPFR